MKSVYCAIPTTRSLPEHDDSVDDMAVHSEVKRQRCACVLWTRRFDSDPKEDLFLRLQAIRSEFLQSTYGVLLLIEDDIVIPPHTAVTLAKATKGGVVAYGFTVCRQPPHQWSMSVQLSDDGDNRAIRPHASGQAAASRIAEADSVPVVGCGLFCTAIPREVVEKIPFRRVAPHHADLSFSLDCANLGVDQVAIPSVKCGHISGDSILYPNTTPDGEHWLALKRVERKTTPQSRRINDNVRDSR